MATVGSKIPAVALAEGTPAGVVNLADLCAGKKIVIFGVPGAFTPGCSNTHLPGYVAKREAFAAKGVNEVVCVAVDNAFVMSAWGKAHNCEGKVRMLADAKAELATALGIAIEVPALRQGLTNKRFSAVVNDGVITHLNVEPEDKPTGLTCSLADPLMAQLA